MNMTMTRKRDLRFFFTALAAVRATVFAADTKPSVVPDGWTTSAPREEIRPKFSYDAHGGRDGKGGFVIAADRSRRTRWVVDEDGTGERRQALPLSRRTQA